ncbi:putative mitochondrion organization and biogenesis protein [Rosellinia necatrix]|uniref:Required for respiratory growth protein 9, mitochondrial n=1 Tax=Rosellinia necatrix TaxID=77044 RepID=A0A1S7UL39_ROSNE|nr:putative mitochondrion organization and biogenesis protein [Rosellinia necatrix]
MNCACQTKSLRIFVQSLTELHITNPIIARSVQLNRLGSPIPLRQAPVCLVRHSARFFGSTSTVLYPRCRWRDDPDIRRARKVTEPREEEPSDASAGMAANITTNGLPAPAPSISPGDLKAAKRKRTIFDYSPESISSLLGELGRKSRPRRKGASEDWDNVNLDAQLGSHLVEPEEPSALPKVLRPMMNDGEDDYVGAVHAPRRENWQIQKDALLEKFPEGWNPRKKLSPDALDGIRALHSQFPEHYTTEVLAKNFEVSPEAIRRILRSKWTPTAEEEMNRQQRWFNRGKAIWARMAELGKKPPRRWRREGIVRQPHWNEVRGSRYEYPYVPRREPSHKPPADSALEDSAQRKLSGNLL